jgi:hypothetical protein
MICKFYLIELDILILERKLSDKTKKKMSELKKGTKNPMWEKEEKI